MPDTGKSRKLQELFALVYSACALLSALAVVSYHPFDPSLNSAAPSEMPVRNLVGLAGSYISDLLLQALGLVAFLIPVGLLAAAAVNWRRPAGRLTGVGWGRTAGALLLGTALCTGLALPQVFSGWPWRWQGAIAPGGLAGMLLASASLHLLNLTGTLVLLALSFVGSLYLLTAFSISQVPVGLAWLGRLGRLATRWRSWREARRKVKLRARLERLRAKGRPVVVQSVTSESGVSSPGAPSSAATQPPAWPPLVARRLQSSVEGPDTFANATAEPVSPPRRAGPAPRVAGGFRLPSLALLREPDPDEGMEEEDELKRLAAVLRMKCGEFGVTGTVTQVNPGPVVTTFEFKPEAGVKYSRVTNLVDDLCLAMQAESLLIERIPGKSTVGIEVPNSHRAIIYLRAILETQEFATSPSWLTMALGKDISGRIRIADLASMPHLLIAGSTGTGKSVAINSFIVSFLYKCTPEQVRLILVDPKRLELGLYEGVPHLMTPIITEPKLAANALRNAVREMERRLKLLAEKGVRHIDQYNRLFERPATLNLFDPKGEPERPLPYVVIVIDELADLMLIDSRNVEESITRLAQMARAVGIHLILATQRPSVDVITGLIKANFPARISFRVATKVDSRTILDSNGAEALLGRGDMLYLPPGSSRLLRTHGPLVTEREIAEVVEFWRAQCKPTYEHHYLAPPAEEGEEAESGRDPEAGDDPLYDEAVRVIVEMGKASTSILQRRLRLGYGRAARLLDMMQRDGIIGPPDGSKPREVLGRPAWMTEVDQQTR